LRKAGQRERKTHNKKENSEKENSEVVLRGLTLTLTLTDPMRAFSNKKEDKENVHEFGIGQGDMTRQGKQRHIYEEEIRQRQQ
jgi:hypothetical protein